MPGKTDQKPYRKEGLTIIRKRFNSVLPNLTTKFLLVALAFIILLFSGCRVYVEIGGYRVKGQVTTIDGQKGISGVTIDYEINGMKYSKYANADGTWEISVNSGKRVKIWAHKDNYLFSPAPYDFTVTKDVSGVDFKQVGWKEDFSYVGSGWDEEDYSDGSYQKYKKVEGGGGEYEIVVYNDWGDASESISTISPLLVAHSYAVEVTTYPYNWDDTPGFKSGTLGLVFNVRELKNTGEFYYIFRIRPDEGEAEYVKVVKTSGGTSEVDGEKKNNDQIDAYNTTIRPSVNILKVVQNGNRASLFVNGVEVWGDIPIEPQDCEFLRAGLYVSADKYNNRFTARFDDFKLYSIGYAPQPQLMDIQAHELKSHKGIEIRK